MSGGDEMTDTELLTDAEIDLMASEVEEVRTPPIRAYWDARRIVATLQQNAQMCRTMSV